MKEEPRARSIKDIHYHDVAFRYYVLTKLGYEVTKACLVHLNKKYVRHGEPDYHNPEGIHHGGEASAAFYNMQYIPPDLLKATRQNVLKYCELDTYAMVKIWERLREVVP